jgi:hypothetical protein
MWALVWVSHVGDFVLPGSQIQLFLPLSFCWVLSGVAFEVMLWFNEQSMLLVVGDLLFAVSAGEGVRGVFLGISMGAMSNCGHVIIVGVLGLVLYLSSEGLQDGGYVMCVYCGSVFLACVATCM